MAQDETVLRRNRLRGKFYKIVAEAQLKPEAFITTADKLIKAYEEYKTEEDDD